MNLSVRRPIRSALLGAAALLFTAAAMTAGTAERGPVRHAQAVEAGNDARVIVKFKVDSALMRTLSASPTAAAGPQHAHALASRLGLALTDGRAMGPRLQVMHGTGLTSAQLAARLAAQSDVEYASVDGRKFALAVVPNDPLYPTQTGATTPAVGQWYLRAPDASAVAATNAVAAWAVTPGLDTLVVADLDTGVRLDHPDFALKLVAGYDFVGGSGSTKALAIANDGDGRDADASDPGDWITQAEANQVGGNFYHCGPQDNSGAYVGESSTWHGTQTAGLIGAATDNAVGMASMGRKVLVQPLRVLGKCGGYDSDIIDALRWAANLPVTGMAANPTPAKVINLSLGEDLACSTAWQNAVNEVIAKGVVIVAAAGNDGLPVGSPANCAGVIAVAGVRHTGTKVGYSNLGPEVTVSAPAGNCVNSTGACLYPILTTSNSGTTTPVAGAAGATYTGSGNDASLGTSFSSPLVAGTVALMLSANPSMTPAQVAKALKDTARPFPTTGASPTAHVTGGPLVPAAACADPGNVALPNLLQNYECYCTTATCGGGLLDAGAAVTAAAALAPVTATIASSASSVVAGTSVSFDGSASRSALGSLSYQWSITAGSGLASFSSATNAATVTLLTTAAGTVTVSLTVTDTASRQATSTTSVTITAPVVVTPPVTTPVASTSSSGGGGAMGFGWLLAGLAAVIAVRRVVPRATT